MPVTATTQTPPATPVITEEQLQASEKSPVRVLVDDANVKIEQILVLKLYDEDTVLILDSKVVITTTDKADDVTIHAGANGQVNARVNGRLYELPFDRNNSGYQSLVINTLGGNDRVAVDPAVNIDVDISTGDGADRITAGGGSTRIFAGKGNDFMKLGSGKGLAFGEDGDDLMFAGTGNAVMSGGKGKDRMYAGQGPEGRAVYLSGDAGDDVLHGGAGKVVLNGGLDNDTLFGFRRTTMYAGKGQDRVHSFDANDRIYAKKTDQIHNYKDAKVKEVTPSDGGTRGFKIEGSPEFISRIEDKMEELRASPVGQKVLEEMDRLADRIGSPVIIKSAGANGNVNLYRFKTAFSESLTRQEQGKYNNAPESGHIKDGKPGAVATQAEIVIASTYFEDRMGLSPLISLFNQMIYAYNGATGTRIPGEQAVTGPDGKPLVSDGRPIEEDIHNLQVIGIPNSGVPFDFDNDPTTAPTTINPYPLYENALREELDIPLRERFNPV